VLILLVAGGQSCIADSVTGQASVIDGDTLEIHGTRIRLWGIDAPESSQRCRNDESLQYRCGAKAANELDTFIARRPVDCSPVSLDQYGRTVAYVRLMASTLRTGWYATDWRWIGLHTQRANTIGRRARPEHAGRGMWAGSYVEPWLFRACVRQGGKAGDCWTMRAGVSGICLRTSS
jgi:endonuclease YncB( thermonuclease family)